MNGRINIRCYFDEKNLPRKMVCTKFWKYRRDLFNLMNDKNDYVANMWISIQRKEFDFLL
jgi:hypothetical protein